MKPSVMAKKLDAFLAKYNPCNIKPKKGGGITCNGGEGCCHGCKHLGPTGCQVTSIACKMWLCEIAWAHLSFAAQVELHCLTLQYEGPPLLFRYDQHRIELEHAMGALNNIGYVVKDPSVRGAFNRKRVGTEYKGVK